MTRTGHKNQLFNFAEPLPIGRLAIEASAGTGKTYALAGLATRFIAETDIQISELLIVTFTRAATNELRSRVRQRLVETAAQLSAHDSSQADAVVSDLDEVTAALLANPDPRQLPRLQRAISEFDSATISTIHGFAKQVLGALGTMSGIDPDSVLVDDTNELTEQICADVVVAHAAMGMNPDELPKVDGLARATQKILGTSGVLTVPDPDDESIDIRSRRITELARESASRVDRARHNSGTMSFDDVLVRLRDALVGPSGVSVVEALHGRFRVALIDEFQDTDPVQWDIFRNLFGAPDSGTSLVLVGDPKQAIYSFRGADIETYLDAVNPDGDVGVAHRSLATNWRSDGAMLNAVETLLVGSTFGDESIRFIPVEAAPDHEPLRIRDADDRPIPALSIRLALGSDIERTANRGGIQADAARDAIHDDLVTQVGALLSGARIPGDDQSYGPVAPSDIAVLVLTGKEAERVRQRLVDNGIPAVLSRGANVLHSPAAAEWKQLLHAMARPADPGRARAFALTWFIGHDPQWVRDSTDQQVADIQETLQRWSEILLERGIAAVVRQIRYDTDIISRVLGRSDGDRDVTDLDHITELLHDAYNNGALSASALLASLESDPDASTDPEHDGDVTSRRVESEAEAVQVMTVWVAKGLEFSIVCIPDMWSMRAGGTALVFHDPDTGERTFDVASLSGGKMGDLPRAWPDKKAATARREIAAAEAAAENLRLLYVALTRARHHTIIWWSVKSSTDRTAISKVLFARTDGEIDPSLFAADKVSLPAIDDVLSTLSPMIERSNGDITAGVHGASPPVVPEWGLAESSNTQSPLQLARLERVPDRSSGRWSFSAIVGRVDYHPDPHDESMADSGASDEPDDHVSVDISPDPKALSLSSPISPLATLPAGADFGTLVHQILEDVDFESADLLSDLGHSIESRTSYQTLDLRPVTPANATTADGLQLLAEGLETAIRSPLGPLFDGSTLADLSRANRLDEMSFELILGSESHRPSDRDIGRLVNDHLSPDDPLKAWAGSLADGIFDVDLGGHLTGSIDGLFRVQDSDGTPRFVVVDYKSNRLHDPGSPPAPGDYSQAGMAKAMAHHHYPLQALLYSVAVHRYLRWRLPDYDPSVNLGGIAYLFVRGMSGPDVGTDGGIPDGVFTWRLPAALVTDLSDLLAGNPVKRPESAVNR